VILDFIIQQVIALFNNLIGLLPNADPSILSSMNNFYSSIRSYMGQASLFVPSNTILTIISIIFVIELSMFTYKVFLKVMSLITLGVAD
jgi:hypothetical protein